MNKMKIMHQMNQEKTQNEDITIDSNDRGSALKYDRFNDLYCQAKKQKIDLAKMSRLNLDEECTFVPNIQKSNNTGGRYQSNQK